MQASAVCGYEAALSWNGVEVMKYEIKVKHSDDNEPPPPPNTLTLLFLKWCMTIQIETTWYLLTVTVETAWKLNVLYKDKK